MCGRVCARRRPAASSGKPLAARREAAVSLWHVPCGSSIEIPGLTARLDKLVHHHGGVSLPADKPHAFVYYITIRNASDRRYAPRAANG